MVDTNIIIGVKMLFQHNGSFKNYREKMTQTGYRWTPSEAMSFASEKAKCHSLSDGFNTGDIGIGALLIADSLNSPDGFTFCKSFTTDGKDKPALAGWIEKAEQQYAKNHMAAYMPSDLILSTAMS